MKEHDPDYVKNNRGYKKRVATKCRVCGGQLLCPKTSREKCMRSVRRKKTITFI